MSVSGEYFVAALIAAVERPVLFAATGAATQQPQLPTSSAANASFEHACESEDYNARARPEDY